VRLRAGEATVGCLYNFVYRSKICFYQCGYDYSVGDRTSPGMVVHAFAVKRAAAAGLAEYDFMAGDVEYKRKLATRHRELHWLAWRAPGVKMRTFELARRTRHKLIAAHRNVRERAGATDVTTLLARVGARIRRDARLGMQRTLVYRIDRDDPRPAQLGEGDVTIAPIARDALERLDALGPFDRAVGERRLDRGDLCYGAWLGGELAHYSWVQRGGDHVIDPAGVTVAVDDGDVWIYNCRTGDAFRGKGLYPRTLARILDDAFAAGAQRAWIYNEESNAASERGIVRAGFQQCAILRALRIGRHIHPIGR